MYDDTENKEIEELIRKIKMDAFKEESFLIAIKKNGEVKKEEFKICTKLYSLDSLNRKYPIPIKWAKNLIESEGLPGPNDLKGIGVYENSQIICHEIKDEMKI